MSPASRPPAARARPTPSVVHAPRCEAPLWRCTPDARTPPPSPSAFKQTAAQAAKPSAPSTPLAANCTSCAPTLTRPRRAALPQHLPTPPGHLRLHAIKSLVAEQRARGPSQIAGRGRAYISSHPPHLAGPTHTHTNRARPRLCTGVWRRRRRMPHAPASHCIYNPSAHAACGHRSLRVRSLPHDRRRLPTLPRANAPFHPLIAPWPLVRVRDACVCRLWMAMGALLFAALGSDAQPPSVPQAVRLAAAGSPSLPSRIS